jgi:UDP-3-O-[3-hydroxymyristoyl] glucosamine N-acyltransferase
MTRTAEEVAVFLGGRLAGNGGETIAGIAELDAAGPGDLSYAEPRFADRVGSSGASCVLIAEPASPRTAFGDKTTITVDNPKAAFARAAAWIAPPKLPPPGVHPTAVVGDGVVLGDAVHIGAHVVIDGGATIGDHTVIYPGCYVGVGSRIGFDCVVHANAVIYAGVEVGDRVVLHAGAVLGSDGFGYVREGGVYLKFPQVGRLFVEDDVEIGANSTIDRGSLGRTVIQGGTKIDNLVHVAHNVRIGSRTVIAAQTGVSGSCDIGDDVVIAGQVGVADHVRIDDGAIVGAQCGIPSGKRIRAGRVFWGTPARPLDDIKIQQAHIARLPKMAAELARLGELVNQMLEE